MQSYTFFFPLRNSEQLGFLLYIDTAEQGQIYDQLNIVQFKFCDMYRYLLSENQMLPKR